MYEDFEKNNSFEQDNGFEKNQKYDIASILDYDLKVEIEIKNKLDSFLDAYSIYLKTKSTLNKSILKRNILEVELLDPSFHFEIE